jgi:hypothetical protein
LETVGSQSHSLRQHFFPYSVRRSTSSCIAVISLHHAFPISSQLFPLIPAN